MKVVEKDTQFIRESMIKLLCGSIFKLLNRKSMKYIDNRETLGNLLYKETPRNVVGLQKLSDWLNDAVFSKACPSFDFQKPIWFAWNCIIRRNPSQMCVLRTESQQDLKKS